MLDDLVAEAELQFCQLALKNAHYAYWEPLWAKTHNAFSELASKAISVEELDEVKLRYTGVGVLAQQVRERTIFRSCFGWTPGVGS